MLTILSRHGIFPKLERDVEETIRRLVEAEWDVTVDLEDDGVLEISAQRWGVKAYLFFEPERLEIQYVFEGVARGMVFASEKLRRFTS